MKLRLAVLASLVLTLAQVVSAQDNYVRPRLITVTGTAEVNVPPDQATLRLGVDTRDKLLAVAKANHDQRVRKVLAIAHAAGIEDKYIQTGQMEMAPEYTENRKQFIAYAVSQSISLTLRDISKYEDLMTKLLEAGVNRVSGVEFDVAEPRPYRDDARTKAIRAAHEKAVAMASELGQKVGKPWEIAEDQGIFMGAMQNNSRAYAYNGNLGNSEITIAPGHVGLGATVRISFLLE